MSETILSHQQIAKMIDISAVQAPHGEHEIQELIASAQNYGFGAVHVLPAWVTYARSLLKDTANIALGSPVGFPSGGTHTSIKRLEAEQMVKDGVDELDMLINIGKLRSGDDHYVYGEMCHVIEALNVPVKVILETYYLNREEIKRACELAIQAGAKYIKTSTGWAAKGATVENVALIAECVTGRIGIKAAGGIRDLDTLLKMYRLGARRFGINLKAAVEIVRACQRMPNQSVVVE